MYLAITALNLISAQGFLIDQDASNIQAARVRSLAKLSTNMDTECVEVKGKYYDVLRSKYCRNGKDGTLRIQAREANIITPNALYAITLKLKALVTWGDPTAQDTLIVIKREPNFSLIKLPTLSELTQHIATIGAVR